MRCAAEIRWYNTPWSVLQTGTRGALFVWAPLDHARGTKVNNIYIWPMNKHYEVFSYKTYLIFLFASLAVSIGLQLILPFPYGLGVALGLFIVFPLLLRKRYMNRMRGDSGGGAGGFFGLGSRQNKADVHYVCLVCRNRYKGGSCPRCGSKMKRADF